MTTRHPTVIVGLVAAALAGMLLAGCADGDGDTAQPGGSMSATPTPTPSESGRVPSTSPTFSAVPIPPASGSAGEITVTGVVEQGVEPNCMLLKTANKSYLLLGGDRALIAQGGQLTVRGKPEPDLMTTCQQGEPFQVTEAKRS